MKGVVSVVIQDKGRVLWQFLEYFGPHLFPDTEWCPVIKIMEEDKYRIKRGDILTEEDLSAKLREEHLRDNPDLEGILYVRPDVQRTNNPARIAFDSVTGTFNGTEIALNGRAYPLTEFGKDRHDIAITTKDLVVIRYGGDFLGLDDNFYNVESVVKSIPGGVVQYEFDLKTGLSRHMYVMNHRPEHLETDGRGLPVIGRGEKTAVNEGYVQLYRLLFGGRNGFEEVEHVEPYIMQSDQNAGGIIVVSSGDTLKLEAQLACAVLGVLETPVFESSGMVLTKPTRNGGSKGPLQVVDAIMGINQQISTPETTTKNYMLNNLKPYLVPGK